MHMQLFQYIANFSHNHFYEWLDSTKLDNVSFINWLSSKLFIYLLIMIKLKFMYC